MATEQLNLRVRDGMGTALKIEAARRGCPPRDVMEELIAGAPWYQPATPAPPQREELFETPSTPGTAAQGCPECGSDMINDPTNDRAMACPDCGYRTEAI